MKKKRYWSEQEIQRLRDIYPDQNTLNVAKIMNRTVSSINGMASLIGLKKSEKYFHNGNGGRITKGEHISIKTEFIKGQKSWNKGKKWGQIMSKESQENALKTTFKKGHQPHNTKENGIISIRKDNRNIDYKFIRVDLAKWIPLHHHVWIQANGQIPKGHIVAFKDKNTMNVELDNLILMTKADNCRRNSIARIPKEIREVMTALKRLKKQIEKSNTNQ